MTDLPTTTGLRPLDNMDRHKIARLICGNDAECDWPCQDCPAQVHRDFNRAMLAIEKAGCVVLAKSGALRMTDLPTRIKQAVGPLRDRAEG